MNVDDYDEFGNYIGAALSDEESDGAEYAANGFGAPAASTGVSRGGVTIEEDVEDDRLEGFNDDEAGMDVDGASVSSVDLGVSAGARHACPATLS